MKLCWELVRKDNHEYRIEMKLHDDNLDKVFNSEVFDNKEMFIHTEFILILDIVLRKFNIKIDYHIIGDKGGGIYQVSKI